MCVVGAGISGIACARALSAAGAQVVVLERGRVPGGRMASRTVHGRPVDTGAAYLTASEGSPFADVMADWVERDLARPWTDAFSTHDGELAGPKQGPLRYGAAGGLRSLVVDLARDLDVRLQTTVTTVTGSDRPMDDRPTVDGEAYDAVVLAMPDPQAERLLGAGLDAELEAVVGRAWQPQLALLAGWGSRWWDVDGVFVNDSDVLSFLADDGARRGDGAPVLVAHSTPAFGAPHLAEPEAGGPAMVAAVRDLLDLPVPTWWQVHRWGFAKPAEPRALPFHLGIARIGLCGDGWGASKVQTAWTSGDALGRELLTRP